uniref:Uncharacterized protein n=1 Tax=Bos indicus x Bos taurus TaxID=30522 RepID=A0A4W2FB07_BOBOX
MYSSILETESHSEESGGSANVLFGKTHCLGAVRPSIVSFFGHSRRSSQKRSLWKCHSATGRKFWSTC